MGSPYPLSYTIRWAYYLWRPSLRERGFPARQPLTWDAPPLEPVVRLLFLGDLMPEPAGYVPAIHPEIVALCRHADRVVLNAEGTVGDATIRRGLRMQLGEDYVRRWLDALGTIAGRTVISVANNHAGDAGPEGFRETWDRLLALGVTPVGSRDRPAVRLACGDVTVGLSAWTLWENRPLEAVAREPVPIEAEILVAYPHWEAEFRHFPRASTRGVAGRLLEEGFALVVGSHPHVVQPMARWGGARCLFSLGNLSRHPLRFLPWPLCWGAALEVFIVASGTRKGMVAGYRVHPLVHERRDGEPVLVPLHAASPALRGRIERRLRRLFDVPTPVVSPGGATP